LASVREIKGERRESVKPGMADMPLCVRTFAYGANTT